MTRKLDFTSDELSSSSASSSSPPLSSSLKRSDSTSSDTASTSFSHHSHQHQVAEITTNKDAEDNQTCSSHEGSVISTSSSLTALKETTNNKAVKELLLLSQSAAAAASGHVSSGASPTSQGNKVRTRKSKHHKTDKKSSSSSSHHISSLASLTMKMANGKIVTSFEELCHLKARSRTPIDIHQAQALTTTATPSKSTAAINTSAHQSPSESTSCQQDSAKIYAEAKNFLHRTSHNSFPIAGVINGYHSGAFSSGSSSSSAALNSPINFSSLIGTKKFATIDNDDKSLHDTCASLSEASSAKSSSSSNNHSQLHASMSLSSSSSSSLSLQTASSAVSSPSSAVSSNKLLAETSNENRKYFSFLTTNKLFNSNCNYGAVAKPAQSLPKLDETPSSRQTTLSLLSPPAGQRGKTRSELARLSSSSSSSSSSQLSNGTDSGFSGDCCFSSDARSSILNADENLSKSVSADLNTVTVIATSMISSTTSSCSSCSIDSGSPTSELKTAAAKKLNSTPSSSSINNYKRVEVKSKLASSTNEIITDYDDDDNNGDHDDAAVRMKSLCEKLLFKQAKLKNKNPDNYLVLNNRPDKHYKNQFSVVNTNQLAYSSSPVQSCAGDQLDKNNQTVKNYLLTNYNPNSCNNYMKAAVEMELDAERSMRASRVAAAAAQETRAKGHKKSQVLTVLFDYQSNKSSSSGFLDAQPSSVVFSVKKGENVKVIRDYDENYYLVASMASNRIGFIPKDYTVDLKEVKHRVKQSLKQQQQQDGARAVASDNLANALKLTHL